MTTWIPVTLAAFTVLVVKSGLKVVPELGVVPVVSAREAFVAPGPVSVTL